MYDVRRIFGDKAFVFYSEYLDTYIIVYNHRLPPEDAIFYFTCQIGNIVLGYAGPEKGILTESRLTDDQKQKSAEFARYILGRSDLGPG